MIKLVYESTKFANLPPSHQVLIRNYVVIPSLVNSQSTGRGNEENDENAADCEMEEIPFDVPENTQDEVAQQKVKDHECTDCGKKFSKFKKLIKHINAKHTPASERISYDTPVLTLEDLGEYKEDKSVTENTENTQADIQDQEGDHIENPVEAKCKDKSDFGREITCQICGFKSSKVSELALHVNEPCAPAWVNDFMSSSLVQKNN